MLDPRRDLKAATPEKLARALLRNPLRPHPGVKPVAGDKVSKKQVATDHSGDRNPHLTKRV